MISNLASVAQVILPHIAVPSALEAAPRQTPYVLSTIDRFLALVAVLFVCGVILRWALRPGMGLLMRAPLRPNRVREDAVALAILVWIMAAAVLSGLTRLAGGESEGIASIMVVGNGAHIAGIAACLGIAATRFDGGIRRFCLGGEDPTNARWLGWTLLLSLVAIGLCPLVRDATAHCILYFHPGFEFPAHRTIEALQEHAQSPAVIAALWLGAAAIAPVAEELFFRGVLQTFLVRLARSRWLAITLASVAFGAVHVTQPHVVAALAVLGLLLGYAYERTGSLLAPILIHAMFNVKTLVWETLATSSL